ncbi:lysM domain receptor-like kinase 3 isoform X2 [Neltuma alba]|uniref:lysM domain receptor-like kinase 3 isoform X2 n=1 Tax=Neltuma alba TaxID=207710 RepID=UPI0010A47F44|nr:lysM domain receptor-like kinase 3 isoform X2 [Prosopis alba]
MITRFGFPLLLLLLFSLCFNAESKCKKRCNLALASYYISDQLDNLTQLSKIMQSRVLERAEDIVSYNTGILTSQDYIPRNIRVNVPFPCDCIDGADPGYVFKYPMQKEDTYTKIANQTYSNLTTASELQSRNGYSPNNIPDSVTLDVAVNCYCGDSHVSKQYGLFITYPLRAEDSLESIANQTKIDQELLRKYNPGADFNKGSGLVFIPGKGQNDVNVPMAPSTKGWPSLFSESCLLDECVGLKGGAIAGLSAGAVVGVLLLAACICVVCYQKKGEEEEQKLVTIYSSQPDSSGPPASVDTNNNGLTVDKSVEFSYEELAQATNNFCLANKIGQGGFGAVYYAELRGEKAAIKMMESQKSKQFIAELKVLTHVHHLNLVRLIGYCAKKDSLFLVYEYIDNGNLSQHLRDSGRETLPWSTRLQIALDSARGLEYIHEHTRPVYIHRDIKPANILIDKNFCAKVADFGLTKLIEVGSSSIPTGNIAGTFGYMPPEYAYGSVSPKIDVYAFGVVLYELISAKEAVLRVGEAGSGITKGLVSLFDEALEQPNPKEHLQKLIDPRLGDQYSIDSVYEVAQVAKMCTQGDPERRPSMRSIAVSLMTLSSTSVEWHIASLQENPTLANMMPGRHS